MYLLANIITTTIFLCCLLFQIIHTSPLPGGAKAGSSKPSLPAVKFPSTYIGPGNGRDPIPTHSARHASQPSAPRSTPQSPAPQQKKTGGGGGILGKVGRFFGGGKKGGKR